MIMMASGLSVFVFIVSHFEPRRVIRPDGFAVGWECASTLLNAGAAIADRRESGAVVHSCCGREKWVSAPVYDPHKAFQYWPLIFRVM